MLKLLTQIIYPDNGSVELKGRVSSLLELGAGFHPDLTGRENIYINASIFGLSRKEIDANPFFIYPKQRNPIIITTKLNNVQNPIFPAPGTLP